MLFHTWNVSVHTSTFYPSTYFSKLLKLKNISWGHMTVVNGWVAILYMFRNFSKGEMD